MIRRLLAVAILAACAAACLSVLDAKKFHDCADDGTCDADADADAGADAALAADAPDEDAAACAQIPKGACAACAQASCHDLVAACQCMAQCTADFLCSVDAGGKCSALTTQLGRDTAACMRTRCADCKCTE